MSYDEWVAIFNERRGLILKKLVDKNYTDDEIVEYFKYDNMKINEPDFCPLYGLNTKCHDILYLNCFNCGCPYFEVLKYGQHAGNKVSKCKIESKYAKIFLDDSNKEHCDCSNCYVPHTKQSALKYVSRETSKLRYINDSVSLLEWIRSIQLSEILGKFKLW